MHRLFLIVAITVSSHYTQAQFDHTLSLHFNYLRASNAFSNQITRNPIGANLSFLVNKSESKVAVGFETGFGFYSGKKYFYETVEEGFPNNFEYLYEENGIWSNSLVMRYTLNTDRIVNPFIQTKFGTQTFFSAIRSMTVSEVYEDTFQFHDTVLFGATQVGVQFDLGRLFTNQDWEKRLNFDFLAGYLVGGEARYRNSVRGVVLRSNEASFRQSITSGMQINTGFSLSF